MKAKPINPTLADRCAEMLADMRREHPSDPIEFAVGGGACPELASFVMSLSSFTPPVSFCNDPTLRHGHVWLRVRWS